MFVKGYISLIIGMLSIAPECYTAFSLYKTS